MQMCLFKAINPVLADMPDVWPLIPIQQTLVLQTGMEKSMIVVCTQGCAKPYHNCTVKMFDYTPWSGLCVIAIAMLFMILKCQIIRELSCRQSKDGVRGNTSTRQYILQRCWYQLYWMSSYYVNTRTKTDKYCNSWQ